MSRILSRSLKMVKQLELKLNVRIPEGIELFQKLDLRSELIQINDYRNGNN